MKKLSTRHKRWQLRRALREARTKRIRPSGVMGERRSQAFQAFRANQAALPKTELIFDERPGFCIFRPPAVLDLITNYEATLAFLMEIRGRAMVKPVLHPDSKKPLRVFTDFAAMTSISPGAGLVLAAEIDRRQRTMGGKSTSHDGDWDPEVQHYFEQAGLFELLGIASEVTPRLPVAASGLHAVRFVRGRSVRGEVGAALRDRLEILCGKAIGPRRTVYDAISEAIANTRHAYPRDIAIWPSRATGSWWAGGTWDSETDKVSLQLYDQGVGIPSTLPRSQHWSDIVQVAGLGQRFHPERNDDRLIAAALEVGRTSTGERGRGQGLAEMASWVDKLRNGFLRITSGRGSVTYRHGTDISGTNHKAVFLGTLIEWEIGLSG
jgi:hypothetical protein